MMILFGNVISVDISVAHVMELHLVKVLDALELKSNAETSMRESRIDTHFPKAHMVFNLRTRF